LRLHIAFVGVKQRSAGNVEHHRAVALFAHSNLTSDQVTEQTAQSRAAHGVFAINTVTHDCTTNSAYGSANCCFGVVHFAFRCHGAASHSNR